MADIDDKKIPVGGKETPIPNRLHDVSEDHVVTGANEVFDDAFGERQSQINDKLRHYTKMAHIRIDAEEITREHNDNLLNEQINAKQLEIGAVETDSEPILESPNMLPSGAVAFNLGWYRGNDNPEWVYLITDGAKRILAGIKYDGSIEWSKGIPTPVKNYFDTHVQELIARLNEIEEYIHVELEKKVDKVEGESLIDEDVADILEYEDHPEFIKLCVDGEGKLLFGIRVDGSVDWSKGVPAPIKAEIDKILALINESDTQIIDSPEWIRLYTDKDGRILWGIKADGSVDWGKGVPDVVVSEIEEQFKKELSNIGINIKDTKTYGFGASPSYGGTFPATTVVTIVDSEAEDDVLLATLKFYVKRPGKFRIGVGHLDQRSWYLETSHFELETENIGLMSFDVADKGVIIHKGDSVFVYTNYFANESIAFNSGENDKGFCWGPADGYIEHYPNGGFCTIEWTCIEMSSAFAFQNDLKYVEEKAESASIMASNALNNNFKVKDRDGKTYKLLVIDGQLQIIPMEFSKVLVIGNSICIHPYVTTDGGWFSSGRGMASSVPGNDYCGILETALRRNIPSATVKRFNNLVAWFVNPSDTSESKFDELFGDELSNNYDLVVFRLSENNSRNIDLIKDAVVACIRYVWSKIPTAEVVITSDVMDFNPAKNAQLQAAALELGTTYVDANCSQFIYKYKNNLSNYVPYYYKGDDNVLYPIQSKFHTHPNDRGMLKVANAILNGIGERSIELSHTISIQCSQDYDVWDEGVEGGIITVLLYDEEPNSYIVTDGNGNNVAAVLHDMTNVDYAVAPTRLPKYGITFIMPASNVNIEIV